MSSMYEKLLAPFHEMPSTVPSHLTRQLDTSNQYSSCLLRHLDYYSRIPCLAVVPLAQCCLVLAAKRGKVVCWKHWKLFHVMTQRNNAAAKIQVDNSTPKNCVNLIIDSIMPYVCCAATWGGTMGLSFCKLYMDHLYGEKSGC